MCLDGGLGGVGDGFDEEPVAGGDEEGGGWDVGDDDLELPADLVRDVLHGIRLYYLLWKILLALT